MCFDDSVDNIAFDKDERGIHVGLAHAYRWIAARITWLEEQQVPKLASWNWSEPTLAEMLVLTRLQARQKERKAIMLVPPNPSRPIRRNRC
jgi:hypothetical protein